MYAQQVIENLKSLSLKDKDIEFFYKSKIVELINNSIKFNIGQYSIIDNILKPMIGKRVFNHNLRLPYDIIWVDANAAGYLDPSIRKYKNAEISHKRGILACKISEDCTFAIIFNYFNNQKIWQIAPISQLVIHNDILKNSPNKNRILDFYFNLYSIKSDKSKIESKLENQFIIPIPIIPGIDPNLLDRYLLENVDEISMLDCFLMLLHCKNIVKKENKPPEKLNKKRIKNGKLPLFSYYTLHIKDSINPSNSNNVLGDHNRIHLCRGHFKYYTEKNPLFGKLTGMYWWQPHVRGQNKDGIIMKDYVVKN